MQLFSGQDTSAQALTAAQNEAALKLSAENARRARLDALALFPSAQQNMLAGAQAGMNVLGQAMPQQYQQMLGGNVAAQRSLLSGLQGQQQAILGGPIDYSAMQPYYGGPTPQLDYQLPAFTDPYAPLLAETQAREAEAVRIEQERIAAEAAQRELMMQQYLAPGGITGSGDGGTFGGTIPDFGAYAGGEFGMGFSELGQRGFADFGWGGAEGDDDGGWGTGGDGGGGTV